MKDLVLRCSFSYHRFGAVKLETLAHAVSTGIYSNDPPFTSPPIATKVLFDGVITVFHNAYEAFKNGGKSQKGAYETARTNLMATLDPTANYVNALPGVDKDMILLSGFTPIKGSVSKSVIPNVPTGVKLERGLSTELFSDCDAMPGAMFYGAILIAGKPLPDGFNMNGSGQILVYQDAKPEPPTTMAATSMLVVAFDVNKNRKKKFIGLTKGVEYFCYYYAGNTAGVSQLSEPVVLMCA